MKASGSVTPFYKRKRSGIHLLDSDLLCKVLASLDLFDLIRCSAVCKSWQKIICSSSLLKDLCYKYWTSTGISNFLAPPQRAWNLCLEELAMEQHRLSLSGGSVQIHQWNGHPVGVNQCRMKMGLILTGVGDKVLRMWSSQSYKCLGEYSVPDSIPIVDFDFDESKIVGLVGDRICIWKRNGKRSIFLSNEGIFTRGLCMRYMDPEAVIGCGDGKVRVFDIYSRRFTRIIRMHAGSVTCLALTDDQLIISGSSIGSISVADLSSGQIITSLKPSTAPTGISSLCHNPRSHFVFAGSTAGYAHCWDLRSFKPLWETRISPNVLYSMDHMYGDTSILVVGGIDGVLRILNQESGEILSQYVVRNMNMAPATAFNNKMAVVEKKMAMAVAEDTPIGSIPKHLRSPITCVAVGLKKDLQIGKVVGRGKKVGRLLDFGFTSATSNSVCLQTPTEEEINLENKSWEIWHRHLGHPNSKHFHSLLKSNSLDSSISVFSFFLNKNCDHCALAKAKALPFSDIISHSSCF